MSNPLRKDTVAQMSDKVFAAFQSLTLKSTGIELGASKKAMLLTRFNRRLKALKLSTFEEYLALVSTPDHPERTEFIDTVTTNLTYFFREPHHFEVMQKDVFAGILTRSEASKPVRLWSAGCSSGQEPYSMAITAIESGLAAKCQVKILCTDIHSKMVRQTEQGIYSRDELRGLSADQQSKWFKQNANGRWESDSALRSLLLCKQLNLFGPWPVRPGVDVIMCRNVLIYFDQERQTKIIHGFAGVQKSGAHLFIGHSETMSGCDKYYRRVDNTVYERI
ncbi:MAG: protein-glutamate O-methyltransferase CheR [Granulosicoccaceae bacterium]